MSNDFWVKPPDGFGPRNWTAGAISPHVDIVETPTGLQAYVELAGVREQDIQLSLHNGTLLIFGEKYPHNREEWRQSRYLAERAFGSFRRSINLPYGLDEDNATASFEDGVLTVHIPWSKQKNEPPGRKIVIMPKTR